MIGLLQSIVDTITSLFMFLWHQITSIIALIGHIPTYVDFLTTSIGYLPDMIMPFCVLSVTIYVVYIVLSFGS